MYQPSLGLRFMKTAVDVAPSDYCKHANKKVARLDFSQVSFDNLGPFSGAT